MKININNEEIEQVKCSSSSRTLFIHADPVNRS